MWWRRSRGACDREFPFDTAHTPDTLTCYLLMTCSLLITVMTLYAVSSDRFWKISKIHNFVLNCCFSQLYCFLFCVMVYYYIVLCICHHNVLYHILLLHCFSHSFIVVYCIIFYYCILFLLFFCRSALNCIIALFYSRILSNLI